MAGYFLDTSALVKRYHREPGTDQIDALLSEQGSIFYISRLSLVETLSAIALRVRLGEVSQQQPIAVRTMLLADIRQKQLNVARVLIRHWQRAELLILSHATVHALRTLDAIQLAIALDLRERGLVECFVSADRRLCDLAAIENFNCINPLTPSER